MALAAGQRTVPDDFYVHSCHCYFLLAGAGGQPIVLHVELVRDGRSFATRTVQARQRGRCIFTVTMSFVRAGSGGAEGHCVRHATPAPACPPAPADDDDDGAAAVQGPFLARQVGGPDSGAPHHAQRLRMWVRARGRVSEAGGHRAHLNALAYISDSHFIGTAARVHRLWRFPVPAAELGRLPAAARAQARRLQGWGDDDGADEDWEGRPEVGIMVSLDHTIYFHAPARVRADEWMLSEMETPWADDGRALVVQRIFARDGTLLATCFQEVSCLVPPRRGKWLADVRDRGF